MSMTYCAMMGRGWVDRLHVDEVNDAYLLENVPNLPIRGTWMISTTKTAPLAQHSSPVRSCQMSPEYLVACLACRQFQTF